MARSMERKEFYFGQNNGVRAVISASVLTSRNKRLRILDRIDRLKPADADVARLLEDALPLPYTPIFTFADAERFAKSPWLTGTTELYETLTGFLLNERARLTYPMTGPMTGSNASSFFVPFSNGNESGLHGLDAQRRELAYVTSDAQFEETFGISLAELGRHPLRSKTA